MTLELVHCTADLGELDAAAKQGGYLLAAHQVSRVRFDVIEASRLAG